MHYGKIFIRIYGISRGKGRVSSQTGLWLHCRKIAHNSKGLPLAIAGRSVNSERHFSLASIADPHFRSTGHGRFFILPKKLRWKFDRPSETHIRLQEVTRLVKVQGHRIALASGDTIQICKRACNGLLNSPALTSYVESVPIVPKLVAAVC